ncbi:MAG TPA: prolyl oligopeptidase family serine peptidase [Candidatus Kapabacteria bacterium]|nr:prolyl oligopeptidase family serine peptidase [Candidatus Kapabacteria bacterium]
MSRFILLLVVTMSVLTASTTEAQLNYPKPAKDDVVDDYFGTQVADPYRWLENTDSSLTHEWVEAENKVTFGYLDKIPFRSKIKARMEEILNYPKYTSPMKVGKYYIFEKNDGLQNQYVVYIQEGLSGEPRVLLDPNTFSSDGTVALGGIFPSNDDKYIAYSIQKAGSDWQEIFVLDLATGKKLNDHIQWVKFSGANWWKNGFFYSRFEEPKQGTFTSANENMKVYYHKLGDNQSKDSLFYEDPSHPKRGLYCGSTEDERFISISINEPGRKGNMVLIKDTEHPETGFVSVNSNLDVECGIIESDGNTIYLQTNKNAPKNTVMTTMISDPSDWKTLISESNDVLEATSFVGGKLIATYMKDASNHVYVFDLNGKKLYEVGLPTIGSASGFGGKKKETEVFYTFSSFTYPGTIYRYDILKNTSTVFRKSQVKFKPEDYEATQVFYPSKDGTKIPMFLIYKKGLKRDGKNPCYLYGYGGFNISLTPGFSTLRIPLLENGVVIAIANLRGGGEYGEAWHEAGTKLRKQNVFDDFIAAANYLCNEKYTSHEKLAIAGGSNGGLLVGAVMTERPDICKVALPAVGVMDMLRYHKFTIGAHWAFDYGTSDDSKEMFEYLYHYSPLHNIHEGVNYPATFITTADHDDRVVPGHSFKFAATLQEKYKGQNPMLIRIETKAGHGGGKPLSKAIEEAADEYSFMFYNLGVMPKY